MDKQHTPETAINFVFCLIYLIVSLYISWLILCIGIIIISNIYFDLIYLSLTNIILVLFIFVFLIYFCVHTYSISIYTYIYIYMYMCVYIHIYIYIQFIFSFLILNFHVYCIINIDLCIVFFFCLLCPPQCLHSNNSRTDPLHRIKILTKILLKMKLFRPKTATP